MAYNQNKQNQIKIDEHIENDPDCRISKDLTIELHGKPIDLHSYRLPLHLTFYNIKNGRFAAEYADLKSQENRELDATNSDDSKKIQQLLLDLDPKQSKILEDDILQNGQKDVGIISHDGYVINGNRRRAVLDRLVSVHGRSESRFIDVARLPENVSLQDLWKIEAGIQLSKNPQLNYGPINELLKFKEGFDAGLSAKEIANALYGGFKENEILVKLEEFKLIVGYLEFIHKPNVFNKAKGIHEHLIYLRQILAEFEKKKDPSTEKIMHAKHIGYQLIHDGVPAREFRKLKDILLNDDIIDELWDAQKHSMPEPLAIKQDKKMKADERDGYTSARAIFNNCLDTIKALSESQQPEILLQRALKNLKSIDKEHCDLNNSTIKDLVKKVQNALQPLVLDIHNIVQRD